MIRISPKRLRLFAHQLRQLQLPILQEADLAVCFLLALDETGDLKNEFGSAEFRKDFRKFRDALKEFGGLEPYREGGKQIGYLAAMTRVPEAEEAICSLDPFVFISHLSAMAWHGLTDRVPKTLFLTRPSINLWRKLSEARLESKLGHLLPLYQQLKLPGYQKLEISRIGKRPLNIWSSGRLDDTWQAAFKRVENGSLRVATIGRCFLDMVREPSLCGGIHHVIEVFEEHGAIHAQQILTEIDHHGNKLEQARAGYLLEQADPAINNEILQRWAQSAMRGGSRKLDPTADYAETYSERWAISINV